MMHNNASMVNLFHLQQCKLYATVFEWIYIQTNLHFSHVTHKSIHCNKECSFAHGIL